MEKIYTSASKVVFIGLSFTACVGFIIGQLPVDQFMLIVLPTFAYYFGKK